MMRKNWACAYVWACVRARVWSCALASLWTYPWCNGRMCRGAWKGVYGNWAGMRMAVYVGGGVDIQRGMCTRHVPACLKAKVQPPSFRKASLALLCTSDCACAQASGEESGGLTCPLALHPSNLGQEAPPTHQETRRSENCLDTRPETSASDQVKNKKRHHLRPTTHANGASADAAAKLINKADRLPKTAV